MKKIKSLLLAAVVLSAIYAPTTLAANYTVIIANATTCRLEYSIGGGSRSSLAIGQAVARSVPLGQQVNLYMYATYQSQYPACGYQVSTATISYYYDATQKTGVEKVEQGTSASWVRRPFFQNVTLNGSFYTVESGQTVQKNVYSQTGVIKSFVYGGSS